VPRIYLVHWNEAEARERADRLEKIGYDVVCKAPSPAVFREIRQEAPDLFLIDLSRLPSQGRDVALNFRASKTTRFVPLVFVEGDPEKVARIKEHLPDAIYTTWGSIKNALKNAILHSPQSPVVPRSVFDGYADAPLVKKLSIKADCEVALIGAPKEFIKLLDGLPKGVNFTSRLNAKSDPVIWFVKNLKRYQERIEEISQKLAENSGLWVAWPKKTSGISSDLSQNVVRQVGLKAGLVDYKICSIDETWSGLKFRKRKA
jgi:CheY-like chemotaxis protein